MCFNNQYFLVYFYSFYLQFSAVRISHLVLIPISTDWENGSEYEKTSSDCKRPNNMMKKSKDKVINLECLFAAAISNQIHSIVCAMLNRIL